MKKPITGRLASRLVALALAAVFLASCAGRPIARHDIPELHGADVPPVASVDLLAISEEMKAFVNEHARLRGDARDKAWHLVYASLHPHVLNFDYDPMVTLTSSEAFDQKRGNCLTFSSMFIAMARYAGLQAWFQEVKVFPEWDSQNDTVLVSMHVNAVVRDRFDDYLIDVSRRERKFSEVSRVMSDAEAEAQYYNNLGADALVQNNVPLAYAYFRKSIELRPGLAYVWSNLGVTLKRNGQIDAAMRAYRAALDYDRDHPTSLNNLYVLYEERGETDKLEAIAARVERSRQRNPYYLRFQAQIANREARYDEAVDYSRRAVRLAREDYRLHYTLAESLYFNGDYSEALASLERARELAPTAADAGRLRLPLGD
jgi:tetratricopeptide (TPR) repeat protein